MRTRVALSFVSALSFAAAPALACVCDQRGVLLWPTPDVGDMPPDSPLLLTIPAGGDAEGWQLVDAAGHTVPTRVARSLDLTRQGSGVCTGRLLFVVPSAKLAPDADYEVRFAATSDWPEELVAPFHTGDLPLAATAPALDLDYGLVTGGLEPLIDAPEVESAELRVGDGADVLARAPVLVAVRGSFQGAKDVVAGLLGGAYRTRLALAMPVTARDRCLEVEQIALTGETVMTSRECVPERCAVLAPESYLGLSSCDGWLTLGDRVWDAVPADQCDVPPTVYLAESGAVDVEGVGDDDDRVPRPVPGPAVMASSEGEAGCSLGHGPGSGGWTVALLGLLTLSRRRRRAV